jgi:hypothetical protein
LTDSSAQPHVKLTVINTIMGAPRCFYGTTPLEEVEQFLKSAPNLKRHTAFITIYTAGLRVSEPHVEVGIAKIRRQWQPQTQHAHLLVHVGYNVSARPDGLGETKWKCLSCSGASASEKPRLVRGFASPIVVKSKVKSIWLECS